jgi:hypothetical protein
MGRQAKSEIHYERRTSVAPRRSGSCTNFISPPTRCDVARFEIKVRQCKNAGAALSPARVNPLQQRKMQPESRRNVRAFRIRSDWSPPAFSRYTGLDFAL